MNARHVKTVDKAPCEHADMFIEEHDLQRLVWCVDCGAIKIDWDEWKLPKSAMGSRQHPRSLDKLPKNALRARGHGSEG
jgi:hypothetical protein